MIHDSDARERDTLRDDTTDETEPEETAAEATATNEGAPDYVGTEETARDDTLTDEDVTDDTLTDEAVTDDTLTDEDVRDDTVTDGTVTDEAVTDDTLTDEDVRDETPVAETTPVDTEVLDEPADTAYGDTVDTDHDGVVEAVESDHTTDAYGEPFASTTTDDAVIVDEPEDADRAVDAGEPYEPAIVDAPADGGDGVLDEPVDETVADEAVVGGTDVAGETADAAEETPALMPGDVSSDPEPAGWTDADAASLRERWQEIQSRFVDDPRGAAADAGVLVGDAVEKFTAALSEERAQLDGWQSSEGDDTEIFRVAVRRYRDLLDRMLG